jgi:hypothetical protein
VSGTGADVFSTSLSFHGRIADDLGREALSPEDFRVSSAAPAQVALHKPDGHFCFVDLRPRPADYVFEVASQRYQPRSLRMNLPGAAPIELRYPGEDEVYLQAKTVNPASKQITFDAIPFLARVRSGAEVLGPGGFSTTLAADLGGVDVTSALLDNATGLAAGAVLRVVRSHNIVLKPGAAYPFPAGLTVAAVTVVEDGRGAGIISGARVELRKVNTLVPSSATVGGVVVRHVALAGPPARTLILGLDKDLETATDARGRAVFYFAGAQPLTALEIAVSQPGFVTATSVIAVTPGQRSSTLVKLAPV